MLCMVEWPVVRVCRRLMSILDKRCRIVFVVMVVKDEMG
jgi:hypothetical protein